MAGTTDYFYFRKYLGSSSLKVRTTSGEKFDRKYFLADFVYLGNVLIKDVSLMEMPGNDAALKDTTYPKVDGLLGLSLIRKGIWKIDFEKNIITFNRSPKRQRKNKKDNYRARFFSSCWWPPCIPVQGFFCARRFLAVLSRTPTTRQICYYALPQF